MTAATPSPKRVPAEVFRVGDFIREELEARGWSVAELAVRMGGETRKEREIDYLTVELLLEIDDKNCHLGDETAHQLELAFGVNHQVFLALDRTYRESRQ